MSTATVTVQITGGPTITVPWTSGMNAQQALEGAWNATGNSTKFTYALQYYGGTLGYLVMMINETYDSFASSSAPFYYWLFSVNGQSTTTGIDGVALNQGDVVGFAFTAYTPSQKSGDAQLQAKHATQMAVLGRAGSSS